ncbi:MAG: hypothetical protein WCS01_06285 [bacterium]
MAAGNFRNDVATRQLLHVALNRALGAIDADLAGKPYPPWYYLESGASSGVGVTGATNAPVMDWIPKAALGPNPNPQPRWVELPAGAPKGRVGFLVVNCSGMLDANHSGAGFGTPRGIGTNVNEIQLSACPDVANEDKLVSDRPYETVQELEKVGVASGALGRSVDSFVCFSSFPTGYVGGTNLARVDISGDETALMATDRMTNIINGLIASGIEASQAGFVFTNLLDFVDADPIPRNLGSACTESVPMFNEIMVSNRYVFLANTNFSMTGKVYFEWFYPFVKPSANTYWIEYNVSFERTGATPPTFPIPANTNGFIDSGYVQGAAMFYPAISFRITNTSYAAFMGSNVTVRAKIGLQMRLNGPAGAVVDASPYPTNLTLDLNLPAVTNPSPPAAMTASVVVDAEVTDPRFNWTNAQWRVWPPGTAGTLGSTNTMTLTWLQARDTDGYADMFVADRPLTSVTELTYLLRGTKSRNSDVPLDQWNTIRLYDRVSGNSIPRPLDRVLDYFSIAGAGNGKGFVNPNTGMTNVLKALFQNMPVDRYPGDPSSFSLDQTEAAALAAFWADTNQNPWRCGFANLSDIGHATNVFSAAPLAGLSPFEREAFFRYTAGLFNTRQQYFMILLFAQTTRTIPQLTDKSVLAGVRAIAEVWRDPLPNADGVHPRVVRLLKTIDNE